MSQGRELADAVGSSAPNEPDPCVRAHREVVALRERTGGVAPASSTFVAGCASLPSEVQACLRPSYAARHVDACVAAVDALPPSERGRFDELARSGASPTR